MSKQIGMICFCFIVYLGVFNPVYQASAKGIIKVKDGVLIRNGLALKVITKKNTVIQKEPVSSSSVVKKIKPFQMFFVFNPEQGAGNNPQIKKNGFYKVGKTTNKDSIIGWINEKVVREWDHREVAKFAPLAGRKTAKIYKNKDDLKVSLAARNPEARKAIAQELPSTSTKRYKVLMPILNIDNENIGGQMKKLYQVAFLDSPTFESQPDKTTEEIIKKHGQIDIMFVIDTTASMRPFIVAIKDVVRSISDNFRKRKTISAQFGVIAYRDRIFQVSQSLMGYVQKTFSPLTKHFDEFSKKLNLVNANMKVGSEGTPEATFDALNAAISGGQGWREHGVKVIILIGDASANDVSKNPFNYNISDILRTTNAKGIRIIAIKIDGEDPTDYEKHIRQSKSLANGMSSGTKGVFARIRRGPASVEEYKKKIKNSISKELKLTEHLVKLAMQVQTEEKIKKPEEVTEAEYMVLLRLLDTSIKEKKSKEKFRFSEGWVKAANMEGIPVIEPHIMISDEDLEFLLWFLDGLNVVTRKKGTAMEKIKKVFIKNLEGTTGEEFNEKEETFADFLKKKYGIPVQPRLLRFTINEMRDWSETKRQEKIKGIREKTKILRDFYGNQSNWIEITKDYRYAYVPLAYLP